LLTYNPKRVCVLCETGINKLYEELKELCEEKVNGKKHSKQKTVKVALLICS
jgi:predicted nucleic acid-binding Zn ribbon protein